MKKVYLALLLCCAAIAGNAQVTGTKTIGVDYPTLAAAITALNTTGINGNVIINVPAGYTETAPSGGYLLGSTLLNSNVTVTSTLTFQKSGAGADPLFTAPVGTSATVDGIFTIQGTDYVTINGLDLTESAANLTTTTQMEWGYGFVKLQNVTPFDGCQNVTIKNCTVTLNRTNAASVGIYAGNHIASVNTALTITATTDAMNNCKFYTNTIQNCNTGIALKGFAGAASPYTLYDQGNDIGGSSLTTGNTIQNFAGASTGSGVNLQYENSANVAYNTINNIAGGGIASTNVLYGVYVQNGTNVSVTISYNTFNMTQGVTASAFYENYIGCSGAGVVTINSNTFTAAGGSTGVMYINYFAAANVNINLTNNNFNNINVATTSTLGLMYNSTSASPINMVCTGNYTSGTVPPYINKSGTGGTFYGYYNNAVSTGGSTIINNNNLSYITLTGAATFNGLYETNGGSGQTKFMRNNIISNITTNGGTSYGLQLGYSTTQSITSCQVYNVNVGAGTFNAISIGPSSNTDTINNCRVTNISSTGGSVYGLYIASSGTTIRVFNDTVNALSTSAASGLIYGIYQTVGTTLEIYKNRIYDLSATGATGPSINGMYLNAGTATVWNNLVGDLRIPNAPSSGTQLVGINCAGGVAHSLYYNTVNLNATTTTGVGVTFGSSAVMAALTNTTFRNNIFVNTSAQNGTGIVAAYRRSSTTLTGYQSASNNNLFYAGTPSATRAIMYDGTTVYQTINTYKALVTPRDAASVTENVSFQSVAGGGTNFLRPSTVTPTQIESNGVNISGITDDHYGTTRAGNGGYSGAGVSPDLGAVEDNYIANDLSAPIISYTALPFTCVTGDRVFTANLADFTGVATGGLAPRVYFKKNAGGWFSTAGTLTSGTVTSGVWTFTITAAPMGGVAGGDIISYYVIAQDVIGTPNIGSSPIGAVATDVNTVSTPPTPLTYNVSAPLSGTYNVGVGQTYTTITAALSAYTTSCISGPVTFQLMDATYPSETYPLVVTANAYASVTNTLTIRPNAGTAVTITSGAASVAVFKFLNAAYVTIDGVNTGGSSLTLNSGNTGVNTCNIWLASTSASGPGNNNIALKNMNIFGGNITSASVWGIIAGVDGATPGGTNGQDNDNITIQGNRFEKTGYAVWAAGTATVSAGGNDNWVVSGNTVGPVSFSATNNLGVNGMFFRNMLNLRITGNTYQNIGLPSSTAFGVAGIYMEAGIDRAVVTNNTVRELATSSTGNSFGIYLGTNVINSIISRNKLSSLHNDNATTGSPMKAITVLTSAAASNDTIVNNLIADVYSYASATIASNPMGIDIEGAGTGGLSIWNNSVYLSGSRSGINAATKGYSLYITATGSNMDIRNNIFVNTYDNISSTTDKGYAVYSTASAAQFSNINYNDYYVAGPNVLGFMAGADQADLAAIQASFGGNLNSLTAGPLFVSSTDAHLVPNGSNVPLASGVSIPAVTIDYDGTTRAATPLMGAHEVNLTAIPPGMTYTNIANSCTTGDQVFTATIADPYTGVATGGVAPRVYFRKGAGTWYSNPGVLSSGTSASGVWTFTITASTMGGLVIGDVVSYYIVSQTNAGYVGSSPYSGAFVAVNVNTVSTPPATPNSFTVLPTLAGTYNVGIGQTYTTLTAAINAYNTSCISGAVTFQLMDATYPSETYPILINQNAFSSAVNTLTIKPASGVNATITGSNASAIIKLNGADYVTIDGSNNGTNSQNLTIANTLTTTSAVIWNAAMGGATGGANNNTFKNLNVIAGANATATVIGIASSSTSAITTGGDANNNLTIQNCTVAKAYYGISIIGTATFPHNNVVLSQNTIGSNAVSNYVLFWGINMAYQNNPVITQNTIFNMKNTTLTNIIAIELGANIVGAQITRNNITGIWQQATLGWGAYGIDFSATGCSNVTIANNFISDIQTINYSTTSTTWNAFGIRVASSVANLNIYHNSINFYGNITVSASAGFSANLLILADCPNIDIRDNIFSNTMTFTPAGSVIYNVYSSVVTTAPTLNYNNYYKTSSASTTGYLGYIAGTNFATLAAWQTATSQEANSIAVLPTYVSASDLHLQSVGANVPFVAGTPIAAVTIDYNGNTRSTSVPVIGAHELILPPCSGTPTAGTVNASAPVGCGTFTTTLTTTGSTTGVSGLTYKWQTSPDNIAPYTDIAGATNPTYTATVSATAYYRMNITCTVTSLNATTAGLQVVDNPLPNPITATPPTICVSTTSTLTTTTTGGTWTSATPAVATVISGTGVVTGVAAGTARMTFTITSTGCIATTVMTVNPSPSAIAITPSTSQTVCLGSASTFTATSTAPALTVLFEDFNSGLGAWTITNLAGTASSYWQIRNPPGYNGETGDGTPMMQAAPDATGSGVTTDTKVTSPSFSLLGYTSGTLTFNQRFLNYSADATVAVEYSIDGGTSWTVLQSYLGAAAGATSWTAAVPNATLTLPPAVLNQPNVKLRWNYVSIWGFYWAIDNVKVSGTPTPAYSWTGISGATGLSCTTCASPSITPTALGNNIYSVTATASGCSSTNGVTVSVNPVPAAIGGTPQVCVGLTTTLTDADAAGTWSSSNTVIATVGLNTGVVTGVTAGTVTISYTFTGTGCSRTITVTVNALPAAIGGANAVCVASGTTLTDATAGGTWLSSNTGVITIGSGSGTVSAVSAGTSMITYTLPTGCIATKVETANPLPVLAVTPTTPTTFCIGDNTAAYTAGATMPVATLLNQDFNSGLSGWVVTTPIGGAAGAWQIVSSGFDASPGDGSQMLQASGFMQGGEVSTNVTSPSFSTIGYQSASLTFNEYFLNDAADPLLDVEYSVNGGSWQQLINYTDTAIVGTGVWSAASPEVTWALPAAAINQPDVKLRWHYDGAFYGWFIDNIKVKGTLPAPTYTWSGGSDLSCTTCTNPTITPAVSGTNIYTVSATSADLCSSSANVTINVNPLPSVIGGTQAVCEGLTTTLTDADLGGTWLSSNTAIATINTTTGVATGVLAGTAMITYTLPTGCIRSTILTVNALPAVITGTMNVCEGLTTTLNETTTGGTWTSGTTAAATVDASGVVTGVAAGNSNITYTITATGCIRTANVVVNPLPAVIGGIPVVCEGLTTTLTNTSTGGTWISDNTPIATIGLSTGVMTGVLAGNANITYTLPTGCIRTTVGTVNALPAVITGTMNVCEGLTTTLNETTGGGTWTSGTTAAATVDASGVVTGVAAGNSNITYTITATGCIRSANVVVNPLPAVIGGTQSVCEGLTTALSNTSTGGTWISDNTSKATIGLSTGVMTGVVAGNANITYTLPTGCIRTTEATVNALPAVITGTMAVCQGLTTALGETTGGGTWTSGTTATATVDASGVVTGVAAGNSNITYTITATGCIRSTNVVVNPLPAVIGGTQAVCEGLNTTLTDATSGGTWTSGNTFIGTIGLNTGIATGVSAGNTNITYTLTSTGCIRVADLTVNALPAAITGTAVACEGLTTPLADITSGGTWSSSNIAMATVDASGVVTGVTAGNPTITYMLPTGCIATVVSTINPLPAVITGTMAVCEGLTTTLGDVTSSGVWISGSTGTATVGASTGVVTGIAAGTVDITYALGATGCLRTANVVVNPTPAAIGGVSQVCATSGTTLTDASAGGTWTSSNPAVATIGAGTGVVSGLVAGNTNITYTLSTGCLIAHAMTVNALPIVYSVTGGGNYCFGGAGMHIGMANSELNNTYKLYIGSTLMGTQPGTGSTVDFGSMTAGGTYTVVSTTSAACSNDMSGSATITVIPLITPSVTMGTTPDDTVCAGTTSTFTAAPVNGGTTPGYEWKVNGITVPTTTNIHSYIPANGDIITVVMTSTEACPFPATVSASQVMVVMSNETPVANIAAHAGTTTLSDTGNICQGSTIVYTASALFGGSTPVYTWYKNGVTTGSTGIAYSYVPVKGDVVFAKLNSNYRCPITNNVSSNNVALRVDSVFIPVVAIDADPGLYITAGQRVDFKATVTQGGPVPTYQWFVNGTPVGGQTSPTFSSTTLHNDDSVSCLVWGTGSCSYFTYNSVVMKVTNGFVQPVTTASDIRMMPNPTEGEFTVNGTLSSRNTAEVNLEVIDMLGQVVYKSNVIAKAGVLNERVKLSNTLVNGMYMLNVRSGGEIKVFHFVLKQ